MTVMSSNLRVILSLGLTSSAKPPLHPTASGPNRVRTDWPSLEPLIKEAKVPTLPDLPTRLSPENWLDSDLKTLVTLLKALTPLRQPSIRAKPCLSPLQPML